MERILRESEFSQRRLGLLIQMSANLSDRALIAMISKQEKLCAKYAELLGKIDETIVSEAQFLSERYDGITDIAGEEAKYLVELWRGQHKVP